MRGSKQHGKAGVKAEIVENVRGWNVDQVERQGNVVVAVVPGFGIDPIERLHLATLANLRRADRLALAQLGIQRIQIRSVASVHPIDPSAVDQIANLEPEGISISQLEPETSPHRTDELRPGVSIGGRTTGVGRPQLMPGRPQSSPAVENHGKV